MTLADLPICMKRGLACQSSLMRIGFDPDTLFASHAVREHDSDRLTLIVIVQIRAVQRLGVICGDLDEIGTGADAIEHLMKAWSRAVDLWNRSSQEERDQIWREHKPDNVYLLSGVLDAGLFDEIGMEPTLATRSLQ